MKKHKKLDYKNEKSVSFFNELCFIHFIQEKKEKKTHTSGINNQPREPWRFNFQHLSQHDSCKTNNKLQ